MNTKDLQPSQASKYLLVGRSGTGKSTIVAQFPGKTYCFDFDRRIQALREYDIDYDQFKYDNFYDDVQSKINEFILQAKNKKFPYQNILVSSLTSFVQIGLKQAKGLFEPSEQTAKKMNKGGIQLTEIQHWGLVYTAKPEIFQYGLFKLQDYTPVNIFLEAHLVNDYETVGEGKMKERIISGERVLAPDKMSEEIPTTFDEVWYFKKLVGVTETAMPTFRCYFRNVIARTNFKGLPNHLDFTNESLYEKIKDKLK